MAGEGGEEMEEEKPRRWARLDLSMWIDVLFRYAAPIGWLLFENHQINVFQDAGSIEEKLNVIFRMLQGSLFLGINLLVYLDHLLRRQE